MGGPHGGAPRGPNTGRPARRRSTAFRDGWTAWRRAGTPLRLGTQSRHGRRAPPRSAASRWAAANPWLGAIARCSRTGSSNPSPSSGESAANSGSYLPALSEAQIPISQRVFGIGHQLPPAMIEFFGCTGVLLQGYQVINTPFWQHHPIACRDVVIRNVYANSVGPNNDGFDPEACNYVLVDRVTFNTGDDCIAIKSGKDTDTEFGPAQNHVIRNCTMNSGHGGITLGSELAAGIRNIFAENLAMQNQNYATNPLIGNSAPGLGRQPSRAPRNLSFLTSAPPRLGDHANQSSRPFDLGDDIFRPHQQDHTRILRIADMFPKEEPPDYRGLELCDPFLFGGLDRGIYAWARGGVPPRCCTPSLYRPHRAHFPASLTGQFDVRVGTQRARAH